MSYTTATSGRLIVAIQPALTIIAAHFILQERLSVAQVGSLALAGSGMPVLVSHGELGRLLGLEFATSDLPVLLAMVSFALDNASVRRTALAFDPFIFFFGIVVGSTIGIAPLYALEIALRFDAAAIATVLRFALLASIFAAALLNSGIMRLGADRAGIFIYPFLPFTAVLGVTLLSEDFAAYHVIGFATVVAGIAVSRIGRAVAGLSP